MLLAYVLYDIFMEKWNISEFVTHRDHSNNQRTEYLNMADRHGALFKLVSTRVSDIENRELWNYF